MFDYIFAFFHLILLIGAVIYAFYNLFHGNTPRFFFIMVCLIVYYFIVLHKNVMKEIKSKRKQK
jgi:hypothetical protein